MTYLVAASAAPLAGPLLYWLLHERPGAARVVDGFVYLVVPLLVAWQVIPYAWEERSLLAVAAVAGGLLVPEAAERASRALARYTDDVALVVGLSGILLHGALEGAALGPGGAATATPFALAVIVHRVPVGLVIWWLVRPRHGVALASLGVGGLVAATVGGALVGGGLLGAGHGGGVELYQAFVAGSLVHVVFHQGRHDHAHDDHESAGHAHHA